MKVITTVFASFLCTIMSVLPVFAAKYLGTGDGGLIAGFICETETGKLPIEIIIDDKCKWIAQTCDRKDKFPAKNCSKSLQASYENCSGQTLPHSALKRIQKGIKIIQKSCRPSGDSSSSSSESSSSSNSSVSSGGVAVSVAGTTGSGSQSGSGGTGVLKHESPLKFEPSNFTSPENLVPDRGRDNFTPRFSARSPFFVHTGGNTKRYCDRRSYGCESRMAVMSAAWFVEFRQRLPWLLHVD